MGDVKCFSSEHVAYVLLIGAPGVIIYLVAVPGVVLWELWKRREAIQDQTHPEHEYAWLTFSYLVACYNPEFFFWEVVIMCRKLVFLTVVMAVRSLGIKVQ